MESLATLVQVRSSLTTVVFDLDGTLFDHRAAAVRGAAGLTEDLGAAFSADLARTWLALEDQHVQSWVSGHCGWQEQRRRRLRDYLPLIGVDAAGADTDLDRVFDRYLRHYERSWSAFPDAAPAMQAVRRAGYQVGVLTNGQRQQQLEKLARTDLLELVGPVWAADDLGAAKPDPQTYLTVCSRLGAQPAETVYVGDNFVHDIEGAEAAGLRAVFLDRLDGGPRDYRPRISTLTSLMEVLEELEPSGDGCRVR